MNRTALIAYTMWFVVGMLMAAAWVLLFFLPTRHIGFMVALTAGALAPAAAVAHVRVYQTRICNLIRNAAATSSDGGRVRSIR